MSQDPPSGRTKKGTFAKGHSGNPSGVSRRYDGWQSALTGIGTRTHDKRESHYFVARTLAYQDAIEMWRGDDLAARAIEALPGDCFRQGYELSIADEGKFDDLKEAIEEQLKELKVDEAIEKAYQYERAYGGGAILIGANDSRDLSEPLDPARVTSLDWLTVLEPIELQPVAFYNNPTAPKYGEPEYYQLTTVRQSGILNKPKKDETPPLVIIHETRLIVFGGIKVSRYQSYNGMAGNLWGDSILVRLADVLRDFNIAWHSAGIIVTDFSQAVFSIENLMALVAREPEKLQARLQAIELSRSTARAVLIDAKEAFKRESTSVAGLPDLLDRLSMRLSAAIDMPLSLLMGQSPKNVAQEGGSDDVRFYYDKVQSVQTRKIGPILRLIVQMIMNTERKRGLPKKWSIKFHPLWQLTDKEKAQARLEQARVDALYLKHGALHPDEVRDSRFGGEYSYETQLEAGKKAPGFVTLPPAGVGPDEAAKLKGEGTPGGVGATAHQVGGYNRRNPRTAGTNNAEHDPKTGGDTTPNRDAEQNEDDQG